MSSLLFTKSEWAAALARGVRQCVVMSWPLPARETFEDPPDEQVQMFALYGQGDSPETLAAACAGAETVFNLAGVLSYDDKDEARLQGRPSGNVWFHHAVLLWEYYTFSRSG